MEITIRSVGEYIEKCFDNPVLKNEDIQVFYRGVSPIFRQTPHIPSIYYQKHLIENEDKIFKEAISFFPNELLAQRTTVEKLIFMQHYRFPTRVMDIGKNPLVCLFFACFPDQDMEKLKKDGIVYLYKVPKKEIKYCDSDAVSVIANLCKRPINFSVRGLPSEREAFNEEEAIQYLVHEIREEKTYFHGVVEKKHINSVVCLRPRMNNPRIVRQDGYFFLFGIDNEKKDCAKINPDWIDDRRFFIPSDAKQGILKELDRLNINESFVYPDYEHVSNHIRAMFYK